MVTLKSLESFPHRFSSKSHEQLLLRVQSRVALTILCVCTYAYIHTHILHDVLSWSHQGGGKSEGTSSSLPLFRTQN